MSKQILIENRVWTPWQTGKSGKITLQQYATMKELAYAWLNEQQNSVKQSTYSNYHYHIYHYIVPYLGEYVLTDLSEDTIIEFIAIMYRHLAANTIHVILTTLKAVLRYGCKLAVVDRKLLEYCRIQHHQNESRILSQRESVRMKQYLLEKNDIFSVAILLCRNTGIRVGELCGLKWGDIHFENETFQIIRTVSRIINPNRGEGQPKTILYIRSPKSYTSIREIPIPKYLLPRLLELRKENECYVLTGTENCTEPRNVQKRFKTLLRRCEMQDCNFHAMRHGFASACFENGTDCKTVSTLLGHSSTKITMDTYIHTSLYQKQNCINSLI